MSNQDQYPVLIEIWEEEERMEVMDRDLDWEVSIAYEEELESLYKHRAVVDELERYYGGGVRELV